MSKLNKDKMNKDLHRDFQIREDSIDEENRTVELAFSSEEEYERWFGIEVLDHDSQSVRLDRLNGGGAVLVNHDTRDQVGVVEVARIDDDRMGRATVRFSESQRGSEIFEDVKSGIRKLVSVGYRIHAYEVTERKGQADLVRVTDWEPYEVSIVSIPADPSVGVGRSTDDDSEVQLRETEEDTDDNVEKQNREIPKEEPKMTDEVKEKEFDPVAERKKIRAAESERRGNIESAAEKFMDVDGVKSIVDEAISDDWTPERAYREIMDKVGESNSKAKGETEDVNIGLTDKERANFSFLRLMGAVADPHDRSANEAAAFELDVCATAANEMPSTFKARGMLIPPEVYGRDLSAGTATDGAELVATNLLSGEYVDILRNNAIALQAGTQMMPGLVGNVDIPRQTAAAAATWISAEGGDATESEPQFDQISMSPKDLAAYTEITRRLRQQSTPAAEGLVRNDLFQAVGLKLDSAIYYGSGSSGQPQGIDGDTGVDDPTFASATTGTYAEYKTQLIDLMRANAASNLVYIVSPERYGDMITVPKQASGVEGNFIVDADRNLLFGRNVMVSTQLDANDFVVGDFSQIIVGEWGGIELNVDPYTKALSGTERYIIFKTLDIVNRRPTKFSFHNAA